MGSEQDEEENPRFRLSSRQELTDGSGIGRGRTLNGKSTIMTTAHWRGLLSGLDFCIIAIHISF